MRVYAYVLNKRKEPLMPTTPRKARLLLKDGKAKVIQRCPFTIQLTYPTGETKQPIKLGMDSGYKNIGFSVVMKKREVISGEFKLRDDVSKKITERRMYRRTRRNHLWYRKPRFLNRKRKEGWLTQSIQHKLDSHIRLANKIRTILPISKERIDVSNFNTQKMQNPEINGVEYQHGELHGYEVKEYLLEKWGRRCAYCGKSGMSLQIEHIVPKSRGGTDKVSNLTITCERCNLEKGNKIAEEFGHPKIQKMADRTLNLKAPAYINNIRWKLVETLNCEWTYGYVTKYNRFKLGLEKSHLNDAFVIAGGTDQERCRPFTVIQVRRNNRSLQKNARALEYLSAGRDTPYNLTTSWNIMENDIQ